MDNLTHALVGATLSKAGADRSTPLATATLVVAANAPDVDVLSYVRGEYFALAFRRGITHGIPSLFVLPFLVTAGMLAWDRWVRRRSDPSAHPADPRALLGLSVIGVATHPALDWLNIYGMRWGLPFDGSWSYGDALFIVDPWIWLALGGAVFLASEPGRRGTIAWAALAATATALVVVGVGGWPAVVWSIALVALVSVRRSVRDRLGAGTTAAPRWAGIAVVAYIVAMVAADAAVHREVVRTAQAAGLEVSDVLAAPVRGSPLRADLEVVTSEGYVPGDHDWFAAPRATLRTSETVPFVEASGTASAYAPERRDRIIAVARTRPNARHFLVWARLPYVRLTPVADGFDVHFGDARYDTQPGASGLAGVTVHVLRSEIP